MSVVPCYRSPHCHWPACPFTCDGRPGAEPKRITKSELRVIYLQWVREGLGSIYVLEAVGGYLGHPENASINGRRD